MQRHGVLRQRPLTRLAVGSLVALMATASAATAVVAQEREVCRPDGFPTGDVNISIWTGTDTTSQEIGRALVEEYEALFPNVHIENTPTSAFDAFTKLTVALPAGQSDPTSVLNYEPLMETFMSAGLLEPLIPEAMCLETQQDVIDKYIGSSIDPLIRDGQLYGMPAQRNAYSLLVNVDKFTEAGLTIPDDVPATWEELAALQPVLHKVDENGRTTQKGFEFRYTSGDQWFGSQFIGMLYQEGGDIFDENGEVQMNTPEAVAAMENWLMNVVDPSVTNNQGPSPYQDFADELDVMAFGGPNALRFAEILNPSLEGRTAVFPLPRASEDSDISGMAYGFHQMINANASDEQKFVASHFIDYMFSDPARWWDRTGQLQPRTGWYEDLTADEGLDVFVDDLANSRALPATPNYGAIQTAIKNAIQRSVFEGVDPAESLELAQQEYDAAVR